ncbi:ribonuclease P protein component [Mycoplasma corogypsi]|uniref:ribonuclease P protein component n=1 Tax=Mycoplasma corogypsi TaxID=2106 RepID=UPI0038739DF1
MKKKYRLRKNWEFSAVMKSKTQLINKYLVVYYKKADEFKVGITVPKKFANAVGRNLYKRQLKAMVRNSCLMNLPYEFVIIARKEFTQDSFDRKSKEIYKLFEKFRKNE